MDFFIDSRLIHIYTLQLIKSGNYQEIICVSDVLARDYQQQQLLRKIIAAPLTLNIFSVYGFLLQELKTDSFVIFDTFTTLNRCLVMKPKLKIDNINVLYITQLGRQTKRYAEGVYLADEDLMVIKSILARKIELFYYSPVNGAKCLLADILGDFNVD